MAFKEGGMASGLLNNRSFNCICGWIWILSITFCAWNTFLIKLSILQILEIIY